MSKSGWWQLGWGWCCVCPAAGPEWELKGNPGLYPAYICRLHPDGTAHRCVAGCLRGRWRRRLRSGMLTPWRKPTDVCCGFANQSYPGKTAKIYRFMMEKDYDITGAATYRKYPAEIELMVLNLTNPTNCCLQYGIEPSFRGVQVARYSLLLKLTGEKIQVFCQLDDILEGERRVAVRPWLFKSKKRGNVHLEFL